MKNILKIITIFMLSIVSSSCGEEGFEVVGTVHNIYNLGFKCWYLVEEKTERYYELVTQDQVLLNEGKKVRLRARSSTRNTICKVGDRIEIISYKFLTK